MASQYTREGCEALVSEVVRCINVAKELGDTSLIDCNTITIDENNKISFEVHKSGFNAEEDLCLSDRGIFQNNMAIIVCQLMSFNDRVFQYIDLMKQEHRCESAKAFDQDHTLELVRVCSNMTPDDVPTLIDEVERVALVDGKWYCS